MVPIFQPEELAHLLRPISCELKVLDHWTTGTKGTKVTERYAAEPKTWVKEKPPKKKKKNYWYNIRKNKQKARSLELFFLTGSHVPTPGNHLVFFFFSFSNAFSVRPHSFSTSCTTTPMAPCSCALPSCGLRNAFFPRPSHNAKQCTNKEDSNQMKIYPGMVHPQGFLVLAVQNAIKKVISANSLGSSLAANYRTCFGLRYLAPKRTTQQKPLSKAQQSRSKKYT